MGACAQKEELALDSSRGGSVLVARREDRAYGGRGKF